MSGMTERKTYPSRRHPERQAIVEGFCEAVRGVAMGEWMAEASCWCADAKGRPTALVGWLKADGLGEVWEEYKAKRAAYRERYIAGAIEAVAAGETIDAVATRTGLARSHFGRRCKEAGVGSRQPRIDWTEVGRQVEQAGPGPWTLTELAEVTGLQRNALHQAVVFGRIDWLEPVGRVRAGRTKATTYMVRRRKPA